MDKFNNLSSFQAKQLINENKKNPNFTIIDVRTKEEYNSGHIKSAKLLDIYNPNFKDMIKKLDKDNIYLIYCRTGARSKMASEFMKSLDFKNVNNLNSGILGWLQQNLKIEKN